MFTMIDYTISKLNEGLEYVSQHTKRHPTTGMPLYLVFCDIIKTCIARMQQPCRRKMISLGQFLSMVSAMRCIAVHLGTGHLKLYLIARPSYCYPLATVMIAQIRQKSNWRASARLFCLLVFKLVNKRS